MAGEQNTINNQSNDGSVRHMKKGRAPGAKDRGPRAHKGSAPKAVQHKRSGEMAGPRFLQPKTQPGHQAMPPMSQGMPMPQAMSSNGGIGAGDEQMDNSQGGGVY